MDSMIVRAAPWSANWLMWVRWKGVVWPLNGLLYIPIGETIIRLGRVRERILRGVKSVGRDVFVGRGVPVG